MNLRAYLSLLRPWRALPLGIVYGWAFGLVTLSLFGRASTEEALAFTAAFIAPLGFGELLFNPIREVSNRSFFPLLANVLSQLRHWHLRTLVVVATLQFAVAWFLAPDLPRLALFGLIAAGLCLPMLFRRATTGTALQLLFILPLLAPMVRSSVMGICTVAPWAVCLMGVGCSLLCIQRAFSPGVLLDLRRARTPAGNQTPKPSRHPGSDWAPQHVELHTLDWVNAVHHARFGAFSRLQGALSVILCGAIPVIAFATIPFLLGILAHDGATTFAHFCNQIVDSSLARMGKGSSPLYLFDALPNFVALFAMFAGAIPAFPACRLPIARHRLATCVFLETIRIGALSWVGYISALCAAVAGASLIAGRPIEMAFFLRPLASALVLPSVVLCELALLYSVARRRWPTSYGVYLLWISGGAIFGVVGLYLADSLTSPAGLVALVPGTIFTGWLFWRAIGRYYRTTDLTRQISWPRSFAKAG